MKTMRELLMEMDPALVQMLYGDGGLLDDTPPVLPMLKKWTGSPRFHLDSQRAKPKTPPTAAKSRGR